MQKNIFFASIGDKPIRETFANYTTHFNKKMKMINVQLYKVVSSGFIGNDLVQINNEDVYEVKSSPIETLAIFNDPNDRDNIVVKCFTLFSHCTSNWSDITIDFNSMLINVWFDIESMPFFPSTVYPITIHSPNSLPELRQWLQSIETGLSLST